MMSEEDEDILFDRSGVLVIDKQQLLPNHDDPGNDSPSLESPVHIAPPQPVVVAKKGRVFQTVCLCMAFFALGLCIAIPGPTLLDLQEQTNTDTEQISRIFTGRSMGYLFGSMFGGLLFDRVNQTCLLSLSLLLTALGTAAAPWCTNFILLVSIIAFQGVSMGFLDTGGNVLCLYIWGRNHGPYMQGMHFAFGLGAFVAPLLAEPFLSHSNSTNITVFENISAADLDTTTLGIPPILHGRYVRDVEDGKTGLLTPAPNITNTTLPPKPKKPNAADAKYLDQAHNVADGSKYGPKYKQNGQNPGDIKTTPPSSILIFHYGGNGTVDNDTALYDTGQEVVKTSTPTTTTTTTTPTTTTSTTTTTTIPPVTVENNINAFSADNHTSSNDTNQGGSESNSDKGALETLKNKFQQVANTVTKVFNSLTKVQFAYLVIAVFILLVSFMFMFHCCCLGHCSMRAVRGQDLQADYLIKKENTGFRVQLLILLFVLYFLYVGMEVTYGGLIMTFSVTYLGWSKAKGTLVNSVFWGSFAFGRLIAIPLANCLTPSIMLVADLVLSTLSLAGLVIGLNSNHVMLWFCTGTLGVGMASIFPTGITWAERYMHVTGKSTSVFVVGSALGEMLLPMFTGFLFEYKGPMWLMYIMLGCAFLSLVIYIIMQNLATNMGERYERLSVRGPRERHPDRSSAVPLHSIDSEEGEDLEMDSVPLIGSSEDLHSRKKKVTFNLHSMENGSAVSSSTSSKSSNSSKGSILKGRTNGKVL